MARLKIDKLPDDTPTTNGTTTETVEKSVTLQRLARTTVTVPIVGFTPLIMQRWSEKAKRQMLEGQQTKARKKKEPRDPQADYEAAFYRLEDGRPGMPSTAFKAAICDAARFYDSITIVSLKVGVLVHGQGADQLVPIIGDPTMREDTPRNANGVADLRYRPQFWPWSATLIVEYVSTMFDEQSVWNLVDAAGRNGVGDWRPSSPKSRTGTFGTFRIDDEAT